MRDFAHDWTDRELERLEKKIFKLYNEASTELGDKYQEIFRKKAQQFEEMQQLLEAGEISKKEFQRFNQEMVLQQKWFGEMVEKLGMDMVNSDIMAMEMVTDNLAGVFTENANYAAWQVCKDANVDLSFTLYDRATVERLVRDDPQLLPTPSVDIPADLRWNTSHIRDEITKGILTGDSIPDIARRLQRVSDMDYKAAVRNARTATTGAQNAGRVHRYQQAERMGIHLQKKWIATLDNRTRHEHRLLDGQICKNGKKFRVEGMEIEYPGDPKAPGRLVYNCRCTLIADIQGVDGTVKKRHSRLNGKSYEQWKYEKAGGK